MIIKRRRAIRQFSCLSIGLAWSALIFGNYLSAAEKSESHILLVGESSLHLEELELFKECFLPNKASSVAWSELTPQLANEADAVVLIRPHVEDLKLLKEPALEAVLSPRHGLLVLGLPMESKSEESVAKFLSARLPVSVIDNPAEELLKAKWLGPDPFVGNYYVRRTFELPTGCSGLYLSITADDRYEAFINGKRVTPDNAAAWINPAWIDATKFSAVGKNVICIQGTNTGGPGGILASLYAIDTKGSLMVCFGTDESWKASSQAPPGDWISPDFNDATWKTANVLFSYGDGPWGKNIVFPAPPVSVSEDASKIVGANSATIPAHAWFPAILNRNGGMDLLKQGESPLAMATDDKTGRTVISTMGFLPLSEVPRDARPTLQVDPAYASFLRGIGNWLSGNKSQSELSHEAITADPPPQNSSGQIGFPFAIQFSQVPGQTAFPPDSMLDLKWFVDDLCEAKATGVMVGMPALDPAYQNYLAHYAQERGLSVNFRSWATTENFTREAPSPVSVYSPKYATLIKQGWERFRKEIPTEVKLDRIYPFSDEPFHQGSKGVDLSADSQEAFIERFGYKMPLDIKAIQDPKKLLDVLNFHSETYPIGWKQVYKLVKADYPESQVAITYDSHVTFGGAVDGGAEIALDDVFHWGAGFADAFDFDIYPYYGSDYRTGLAKQVGRPRISQVHYGLAQVRNLAYSYDKSMGFWIGTLNDEWFRITPAMREYWWQPREMIYTAIAGGCDLLTTGIGIPEDASIWGQMKEALHEVSSIAPLVNKTRKTKAQVCFLFPRTQFLLLQKDCWNSGIVFELFLRAFGDVDILHEDQIVDDKLDGYKAIVLADVNLLPSSVSERISSFVKNGGILITDKLPTLNESKGVNTAFLNLAKEPLKGRLLVFQQSFLDRYLKALQEGSSDKQNQICLELHKYGLSQGLISSVYSSNPDIEASLRTSRNALILFVINHESKNGGTQVVLHYDPFIGDTLMDPFTNQRVMGKRTAEGLLLDLNIPFGRSRVLTAPLENGT